MPFTTRLFWAAVAFVVLSVAYQGLGNLTPGPGTVPQMPLEQHRDTLIEDLGDVADTLEEAG